MPVLPVILHPDAVLRKPAEVVEKITPDILRLLDDMIDTMYSEEGIGLAAPQVNISQRLIVLDIEHREKDERGIPIKMINPEIIAKSDVMTPLDEGCLSLPDMRVEVLRPEEVTVRYMDTDGKIQEIHGAGLMSKALQHEIDHLNGVLIFDYLSKMKRDIVLRKYNKAMRQG